MHNMDDILNRIKTQIELDKENLTIYRNEKSRDVTQLIDLLSNVDLIINGNKQEVTEFISQVLSQIFDEDSYIDNMKNIRDLIDKYRNFIDNNLIKSSYDNFLKKLCEIVKIEKIKIEQKAEEEHDLMFGNNDYEIIANKIENNDLLLASDIELITKLFNNENFEEMFKVLKLLDDHNTMIFSSKKDINAENNILNDISVKKLFDKYYRDANDNLIVDNNGKTVYERLPDKFKVSLIKQYRKEPTAFSQIFDIIFMNDKFKFIRVYGTTFNNEQELYNEQKELCKFLKNADYSLLNEHLGKLCEKYGFTMESLFQKIPGIYKRVSKTSKRNNDEGFNVDKDELIIKGSYEHFEKNMKYLEQLDSNLPQFFMSKERYYKLLIKKHDQFKRNIDCATRILGLSIDEVIKYANEIITPSLFADNVTLLEEYGLNEVTDKGVLINILGIQNLKSRISAFIESGTFSYLNGDTNQDKRAFTGRLTKGMDYMKKFYYGNSTRINGLIEMEDSPSRLVISARGVKGSSDNYSPNIMRKHYNDIDNFVNPDLLKKIRGKIPKYIQTFIGKNFERCIKINKNRNEIDFSNNILAGQSVSYIINYFDHGSYIVNDENGNVIKSIPYYVDEYTYSFNGILVSRHKFIDMIYLYIECLAKIEKELWNLNILPDDLKDLTQAKEFLLSNDNLGVLLLNALVQSSNCSHYALLKLIKEVFAKSPFEINLESSFNDILYNDKKIDETKTTNL